MKEDAISAHLHDGGLAFPSPVLSIRSICCDSVIQLLEPYGANQPFPTGATKRLEQTALNIAPESTRV